MSVLYITSFANDHLDLYGNRFIESFNKFSNSPLIIYAEGFTNNNTVDFEETIPEHKQFKNYILKTIDNLQEKKQISRLKKALRWSYKSYSIIHALENYDYQYIVWIDGDVETVNNVPVDLPNKLCKDKLLYGFKENLNVNNTTQIHIESGFVIFNKNHQNINKVINGYKQGYYNRLVLNLSKPWDGFWLHKIITDNNLTKDCEINKSPFSTIHKYFHHHVGKQKFQNKSVDKHLGRNLLTT